MKYFSQEHAVNASRTNADPGIVSLVARDAASERRFISTNNNETFTRTRTSNSNTRIMRQYIWASVSMFLIYGWSSANPVNANVVIPQVIPKNDTGFGQDGFVPGQFLPNACHYLVEFHLHTHGEFKENLRLRQDIHRLRLLGQDKVRHSVMLDAAQMEAELKDNYARSLRFWNLTSFPVADPWPMSVSSTGAHNRPKRQLFDFVSIGISTVALAESSIAVAKASKNTYAIEELKRQQVRLAKEFIIFGNKTQHDIELLKTAINDAYSEFSMTEDLNELIQAGAILNKYMDVSSPFIRNLRKGFIHPSDVPEDLWSHARHLVRDDVGWEPERYGTFVAWNESSHTFVMPVPTTCKEIYERLHDGTVSPGGYVPYGVQVNVYNNGPASFTPIRRFANGTELNTDSLVDFNVAITDISQATMAIDTHVTGEELVNATITGLGQATTQAGNWFSDGLHWIGHKAGELSHEVITGIFGGSTTAIIVACAGAIALYCYCYKGRCRAAPSTTHNNNSNCAREFLPSAPPAVAYNANAANVVFIPTSSNAVENYHRFKALLEPQA